MVSNDMIEKSSGLWIALTRLANLYCDHRGGLLQDVDIYGKGFYMAMTNGTHWVKWEETTSFLAALDVR